MQSLATIIYIYLATITKAITFGGFLSEITHDQQGVLEAFLGKSLISLFLYIELLWITLILSKNSWN